MAPLVREHGHPDTPPAVQWTEEVFGRQFDIGEEHLVELRLACHLAQRADLDTRQVHREQEEADAVVLAGVRVRAGHQDAPVAVATARAPHLLTVDDVVVAVEVGTRRERAEVAAGTGLAEQLAPQPVGGERRAQMGRLLLGRTELQDRAAGEHDGRPC